MKAVLLIVFIFIAFSFASEKSFPQEGGSLFSDSGFDSVNIRAVLMKQINLIKQKQNNKIESTQHIAAESLSEDSSKMWKYFALLEAALLISLAVMWKRRRAGIKAEKKETLKQNIGLLRKEKIGHGENTMLKNLRKNLQTEHTPVETDISLISKNAKKLSISKGELLLAQKLRLMQR